MEEKTNIELLQDFARSTNRTIHAEEIPYPKSGVRTFTRFKRMVCIPNDTLNTSFFVAFSDPYAKIGDATIFCGVFIPLEDKLNSKLTLRQQNILDKLNIFTKTKANRTGNSRFDSKVIVSGDMDMNARRLLTKLKLQNEIVNAVKIDSVINVVINEYNLDFVPELKNKSYLGIIDPQKWNLDHKYIEKLFEQAGRIKNIILA